MSRKNSILIILLFLISGVPELNAQSRLEFGNISVKDLSNLPYKPDPGAGAVILSDIGLVTVNYNDGFYVELERDVKIRIENSRGFDYASVEIPLSSDDIISSYKASSFNLRNGEKAETKLTRKDFISEKVSRYRRSLKFNMPDVREGTVIEYAYKIKSTGAAISTLVTWAFQKEIPIANTSLTVIYPEYFSYKNIITGNPNLVNSRSEIRKQYFGGELVDTHHNSWFASNVPAFVPETKMKSLADNQTRIHFELGSVNYTKHSSEEITPTYATLSKKLLERDDFGRALQTAFFAKKPAREITAGINDDVGKLKAIHKYVSEKMLWDGVEDFTASSKLATAFKKGKGSSADINLILIAILRHAGLMANPVILSTRSNGSINEYFAMIQQFNYVIASVQIDTVNYLVDATDPERPYNILPFECLNGKGRLISGNDSRFVDLKNQERRLISYDAKLKVNDDGSLNGDLFLRNSGYEALNDRELIKLEGEDGYKEIIKSILSGFDISDISVNHINLRDSDLTVNAVISSDRELIQSGNDFILNPFFSFVSRSNPFTNPERSLPVDFGSPDDFIYTMTLNVSEDYSIAEIPENFSYNLGGDECTYEFMCEKDNNRILLKSIFRVNKPVYTPNQYPGLRDFYSRVLTSQSRPVILRKKS